MKTSATRTFFYVYFALLVLLVATIACSFVHLGRFNVVASLTIACAKMVLIAMFFMHLRQRTLLTVVFAVSGLFWLGILLVLASSDFLTRGWPE